MTALDLNQRRQLVDRLAEIAGAGHIAFAEKDRLGQPFEQKTKGHGARLLVGSFFRGYR